MIIVKSLSKFCSNLCDKFHQISKKFGKIFYEFSGKFMKTKEKFAETFMKYWDFWKHFYKFLISKYYVKSERTVRTIKWELVTERNLRWNFKKFWKCLQNLENI